jgi:hypothetical protein
MGFFSFKCAKSNASIPAYPDAGLPKEASLVIMITPKDRIIEGIYDGYGNIGNRDIYAEIAQDLYGKYDRDLIFGDAKFLMVDNRVFGEVKKFQWDEPIKKSDVIASANMEIENIIIGSTLNELQDDGAQIKSIFDSVKGMIKIVRKDHYNGEKYNELIASKDDPDQGFFYDEKMKKKIFLSLMTKQDFSEAKGKKKKSRSNPSSKKPLPAFYSLAEISEDYSEFPVELHDLQRGTLISIVNSVNNLPNAKTLLATGTFQIMAKTPSVMVVSSKKTLPSGNVFIKAEGIDGFAKAHVHLSQTGDIVLGSMGTKLIK